MKLVVSNVVKGIQIKITAKFRDTEHLRFEDTKRIMSPEKLRDFRETGSWGPFLESPETFRVTQFSLYLKNEGVLCHETLRYFNCLFPLQHMERPALWNKRVGVLRIAFRARKVFGSFEKRTPGPWTWLLSFAVVFRDAMHPERRLRRRLWTWSTDPLNGIPRKITKGILK